ncbi:cadmium resistance transporter [Levilactobacillus namurensis]|uniref:cadmium resistance transporter n=1 Tax=Levilactobacillus namurensis TaxID=380393 RepID=UPI00223156B5|nr:cadmium resistance transporter [Levilactobacillus namurensis]MCW3778436.1 cadmium resistance transporter [Levilactobacillus namurensis]MDT7019778.1 cadmium resistance transporter [Levilactobacillus namurensis]WNN65635.1 cadmium resistance transporter [Levilactobacillus namurensis]
MLTTIATGIVAYASTSIDCLILLTILFGIHGNSANRAIYLGDCLGTTVLLLISGLCAYPLRSLPQTTIMGVLGIFPILIGLKTAFTAPSAQDSSQLTKSRHRLSWTIATLIISTGADNISVYVPLLTQALSWQIVVLIITLFAMLTVFYWAAKCLAQLSYRHWLQRNGHYVTAVLYLFIGCSLLFRAYAP